MTDLDHYTIEAMEKHGGSFVKALAQAARHADPRNLWLIKQTWPIYWAQYEKMAAMKYPEHLPK